jgi:hypothetical protein
LKFLKSHLSMSSVENLLQVYERLLEPTTPEGSAAWEAYMFNIPQVRSLATSLSLEQARRLLNEGSKYAGGGWTTSRASRVLWDLVGVPLVAAEVSSYRNSWLFALAMVHNVEVGGLDLSDRASEAAFALASLISQPEQWLEQPSAVPKNSSPEEEDAKPEDAIDGMDWDEPEEPLPAELAYL